jgi:hypothetical protein
MWHCIQTHSVGSWCYFPQSSLDIHKFRNISYSGLGLITAASNFVANWFQQTLFTCQKYIWICHSPGSDYEDCSLIDRKHHITTQKNTDKIKLRSFNLIEEVLSGYK